MDRYGSVENNNLLDFFRLSDEVYALIVSNPYCTNDRLRETIHFAVTDCAAFAQSSENSRRNKSALHG